MKTYDLKTYDLTTLDGQRECAAWCKLLGAPPLPASLATSFLEWKGEKVPLVITNTPPVAIIVPDYAAKAGLAALFAKSGKS